ncbi:unnamed protein product, partial [Sphacelaria rigidula]
RYEYWRGTHCEIKETSRHHLIQTTIRGEADCTLYIPHPCRGDEREREPWPPTIGVPWSPQCTRTEQHHANNRMRGMITFSAWNLRRRSSHKHGFTDVPRVGPQMLPRELLVRVDYTYSRDALRSCFRR